MATMGPGSAEQRFTLHRVRDTRDVFVHLHSVAKAAYLGRIVRKAAV